MASTQISSDSIPSLNPGYALLIYVVIPWIPMFIGTRYMAGQARWPDRGNEIANCINNILCNFSMFLYKYAPMLVILMFCWTTVIMINQALFVYTNLSWSNNVFYYLNVDLPQYDFINTIAQSATTNSYNALTSLRSNARRRLQLQSVVESDLTIVYHTKSWENLLTEDRLKQICLSERNLLIDGNNCISTFGYQSIIKELFNTGNCEYLTSESFESKLSLFTDSDNTRFVQDNVKVDNPQSSVILSHFRAGACEKVSPDDFTQTLEKYSYNPDELVLTYSVPKLNKEVFFGYTQNAVYYVVIACLAAFIVLAIGIRGLFCTFITFYGLFFSVINSAAFLPLMEYNFFSVFSGAGLLILVVYGCNVVIMYGSAWRRQVRAGINPTIPNIINAYATTGQTILYITCFAQICLFSLTVSPVIVVKQFGAFTALAIASFYLIFHYLIVPAWILSSWFTIPKRYHRKFKKFRKMYYKPIEDMFDFGMGDNMWTRATIMARQDDYDSDDSGSDYSRDDMNSVVPHDQVQYLGQLGPMPSYGNTAALVPADASYGVLGNNADHIVSAASAVPVEDESQQDQENTEDNDVPINELQQDTHFCRGKRPLKCIGFLALLVVIGGLIAIYIISVDRVKINLGIPEIVSDDSNFGRQLYIFEKYKADFFRDHTSANVITETNQPTLAPTNYPTFRPSSSGPTRSPTLGTSAPSILPTVSPTHAPTNAVTQHVDFRLLGCWGVGSNKKYRDEYASATYNLNTFDPYNKQGGLLFDMLHLCDYVEDNRDYLNVHPFWNRTRDCIYDQIVQARKTSGQNASNTQVYQTWAASSYTAGSLVGLLSYENTTSFVANPAQPLWVCSNFSVRTQISSIEGEPEVVKKLKTKWEYAFESFGSVKAKEYNVETIIGSDSFTYPLLSDDQKYSLKVIIAATLCAFGGLLWVFTLSDFGLTIFGSLSIFTVISIMICLHLYLHSRVLDMFDMMIIVGIVVIIVEFPIQLIEEYMTARAYVDRQQTVEIDKALSPALAITNRNMRHGIIIRTILVCVVGIAPLYSGFRIFRRVGSYMIMVSIISSLFAVFLQPYLLAFGCRTRVCDTIMYETIDEDEDYAVAPAAASRISHSGVELTQGPADQGSVADESENSSTPPGVGMATSVTSMPSMPSLYLPNTSNHQMVRFPSNGEMLGGVPGSPPNYPPNYPPMDPMQYPMQPPHPMSMRQSMSGIPPMQPMYYPPPGHGSPPQHLSYGRHPSMHAGPPMAPYPQPPMYVDDRRRSGYFDPNYPPPPPY